jgi:hypothetical protein
VVQFLAGYIKVVLTPPLQLKISRTPAENTNVAENTSKKCHPHVENFFCYMESFGRRHPAWASEFIVGPFKE